MPQTRTVTILFCDLVGSTALMTRLGDDANDRVRRRFFAAIREAVVANRGEEVKTAGDGMMVAFPASALDAVSCAVAMQRGVSRLAASDPLLGLAIRVGISSGECSFENNDWFGLPAVEAARLEHAARTGQILCADVTRILVGNRGGHSFTPVGALELKGLQEPLPACEVAWDPDPGLASIPLPSGLAGAGFPFAGRAKELAELGQAWEDTIAGNRRFVLIQGEGGIGKTRLAAEFAASIHVPDVVVLYGRSETDREIPYQPFAEALRWYVLASQPAALREQVGIAGGELTRIVPTLRMRLPDLPEPRAAAPAVEQQALFDAVFHTLSAVAERTPVLLVVDDLEQAGAQTLALLHHVVTNPGRVRLLVVGLAGEATKDSPWATEVEAITRLPGAVAIALAGLAESEVDTLVERADDGISALQAPPADPGTPALNIEIDSKRQAEKVADIVSSEYFQSLRSQAADLRKVVSSRIFRETEGSPRFVGELIARLHESGDEPQSVLDAACPYMGLRSFEARDSGLFFGRDEVVGALLGRLSANRMLSVVGASGSGKSSLVRAGLVPRLKDGALPGSRDWEVIIFTPGVNPLEELAMKLGALAGLSATSILRDLEADTRTLDLTVRQVLANRPESARVLLVVDQFEELFTLCRDDLERQRFIDALLAAIAVPGGRTMAIVSMRADFYGEAARYPSLAEALEVSHALLGPMNQDDLLSVIERPAEATGLRLEPGLADRILRDVGDEPGGLPLLSHALLETWKRRAGRTLTAAGYAGAGGVRGAIAQTAETVFGSLPEADQAIAHNLFVRLTELGEGTEDTRRRVAFSEVVPASASGEAVRAVITRLADARLLTTSAESVEVAHEALIREWPRLRSWLDDDRDGLRVMRHLTESAQAWERLGRDEGELYRGTRLTAATEWTDRAAPDLNPLERDFLDASRELHERELREARARVRRLRVLATVASALAVVAVVVGGLAAIQWRNANDQKDKAEAATGEARAQRDVAEAAAIESTIARLETDIPLLLKTDRSLAFLLARQAYALQTGARTTSLLNRVLTDDPRWIGGIQTSESVLALYAGTLDGKYIATSTQSGLIELHDASTHSVVASARGTPGLTQNTNLQFLSDKLLVQALRGTTGDFGATVFSVPGLEVVRKITWDKDTEAFATADPATGEIVILRKAAATTCCQTLRIVDAVTGRERTVTLPALTFTPFFWFDAVGRFVGAQLVGSPTRIATMDAQTFALTAIVSPIGDQLNWWDLAPDGSTLVTGFTFGNLQTWDTTTGSLLGTGKVNNNSPGQFSLGVSGKRIVAILEDLKLSLLDVPSFKPIGIPFPVSSSGSAYTWFGAGENTFFSWSGLSNIVEHWALDGHGLMNVHSVNPGPGRAAVAPDGSWFVKQAADGSWARWSLPGLALLNRSGAKVGATANNRFSLTAVSPIVSSDGRFIATTHTDCPVGNQARCSGRVVLWDSQTGLPVGEPIPVANPGGAGPGIVMAFHPGLPLLAVGGSPAPGGTELNVQIWSVAGGTLSRQMTFVVQGPFFGDLAFVTKGGEPSPLLAIWTTNASTALWDVGGSAAKLVGTRQFGRQFMLATNPQGQIVIGDGTDIKFFEPEQFVTDDSSASAIALIGAIPTGAGQFTRVSFTTEGKLMGLAQFGGAAGRVSVWDMKKKESIGSSFNWLPSAGPGKSDDVFLAPDGSFLVTSNDSATVVWDLDVDNWQEKACFAAGRNLTEAEWTKYFPGRHYEAICAQWPAKPK